MGGQVSKGQIMENLTSLIKEAHFIVWDIRRVEKLEEGKEQRAQKKKEKVNYPVTACRMDWKKLRSRSTGRCNCPT